MIEYYNDTPGLYRIFRALGSGKWSEMVTLMDVGDACLARGVKWGDINADGKDDFYCIAVSTLMNTSDHGLTFARSTDKLTFPLIKVMVVIASRPVLLGLVLSRWLNLDTFKLLFALLILTGTVCNLRFLFPSFRLSWDTISSLSF